MKQVFYNIYPPKELASLPADIPHPLYISEYDWKSGIFHMMHQHSSIFEILIILSGQAMYTLGHRRFFVQAGDVIVCNSEVIHDELLQQTPYKTLCLGGTNLKLPGLPENHLLSDSLNAVFHAPEQFHDLRLLMERMQFYVNNSKPYYQELCRSLLQTCITLVLQMIDERSSAITTQEASITARIEDYISSHYAEDLSLASIGKQFYINPYHLAHIFKAQTGHSVK